MRPHLVEVLAIGSPFQSTVVGRAQGWHPYMPSIQASSVLSERTVVTPWPFLQGGFQIWSWLYNIHI